MTATSTALTYQRLLEESPLMMALRKDTLPVMASLFQEHLGEPGTRIETEELHDLIDADLEELRDHFPLGKTTGKGYCDRWREDGLLHRTLHGSLKREVYELSADGHDLLRILSGLETEQSAVTESRLVSITSALHRLAIETDPDKSRRLALLQEEKAALDREIERLSSGEPVVIPGERARERVLDILDQARTLPADFVRVRARVEEMSRELRASIVSSEDGASDILEDVWSGVDLLETSDEGKTFQAFADLVRDPEASAVFDDDVSTLLERQFAEALPIPVRGALRSLRRELADGNRGVQSTMTEFARSLRRYVFSSEYRQDQVLQEKITEALGSALKAAEHTKPFSEVPFDLELSRTQMFSIGEVLPWDPSETEVTRTLVVHEAGSADFEELAAKALQTEIDFESLRANINAVWKEEPELSEVSVKMVLDRFPATQGLASVVGLLGLATTHGKMRVGDVDVLEWSSEDGSLRRAEVPRHVFLGPIL